MIRSEGKNRFVDNVFDYWEWSASILQTPEEAIQKIHALKLEGRVVKDIIAVGRGYNWGEEQIDEAVYNALERLHPLLKAQIPNPDAFLPKGLDLLCFAEIDQPLIIVFEDGDSLGISFDEESCVRMDLNSLPLDIAPHINQKNFHAGRLFYDMVGRRITNIEVTATTEEPVFTRSHEPQLSYIKKVDILYNDDTPYRPRKRLSFEANMDYGWVSIVDYTGRIIGVPTENVPWIVEGYITPENLED